MKLEQIFLSVIVCTYNRSTEMSQCVTELAEQAKEFSDVEILIVDNNSRDDTKNTGVDLEAAYPGTVRYCFEEVQGLCRARNRGREEARGEIMAIVDDDAIPHPNWVATVRQHFVAKKSDALTGRIYAKPIGGLPKWFPDNLTWVLAEYERGTAIRPITHREGIPGGHFAITVEAFDEVGGFNEKLRIYSEEVEFFERFLQKGLIAHYHPEVKIDHRPDISRMSRKSLLQKAFNMGRGVGSLNLVRDVKTTSQKYMNAISFAKTGVALTLGWVLSPKRFDRGFTAFMNFGNSYQLLTGEMIGNRQIRVDRVS